MSSCNTRDINPTFKEWEYGTNKIKAYKTVGGKQIKGKKGDKVKPSGQHIKV
jgi:hypothetical protein